MATVAVNRSSGVDQFISAVKAVMEARGLTIVRLAEITGLSRPYLSKMLSGHQRPSMDVADQVAKKLGLEIKTVPRDAKRRSCA